MKKILFSAALVSAILVVSCNKNVSVIDDTEEHIREVELTINAKPATTDTKTYIEKVGTSYTPYWKSGDKLCIMNVSDLSSKKTFTNGAADGEDASFTGTVTLADGTNTLYGFYPQNVTKVDRSGAVYKLTWGDSGVDNDKQTLPSLTSFDPLHDVMVAKPLEVVSDGVSTKTTVEMQFKRIMAVVKLILVDNTTNGYLDAAKVTSVKLTSSTTNLAGRISFDTSSADASVTTVDGVTSKSVTASYAGGDFAINGVNAAFIIIPPVTLAAGSTLTIDVVTDDASLTISKAVALPKDFVFAEGIVTPLTVSLTDACVVKSMGASLSLLKSSVSGVAYAGASGNTITEAYSLLAGDDSDIVVTYDGTVVTAASISGGTVTYTTSTNPSCSRTGWIGLEDGSAVVKKIFVNQNYNSTTVTAYTWDITDRGSAWSGEKADKTFLYNGATISEVADPSNTEVLYIHASSSQTIKIDGKDGNTSGVKQKYYFFNYGGQNVYLFINTANAGLLRVLATTNVTSADAGSINIKINGAEQSSKDLGEYNAAYPYLGAKEFSWSIPDGGGVAQEIQIVKSSGKNPYVYKVVLEIIN